MTALDQYQRLEATGVWRPDEETQRRDVIVTFGNATLTISSSNDVAVSHWSLAAVHRENPGARPAIFSPGGGAPDRLEIADDTMIDAIEMVRKSIERGGPHPRRLRLMIGAALLVFICFLSFVWLPNAVRDYTARIVPATKQAEIGRSILADIEQLTGAACSSPLGQQALADLALRLGMSRDARIVVLRQGARPSRHLPGGIILLNRLVVEDFEMPEIAAGFVLAELERQTHTDPFRQMLDAISLRASASLLTTGDIDPRYTADFAEHILAQQPQMPPINGLIERFERAQISAAPYAYAVDITGEATIDLIEGDPITPALAKDVLDDGAWISMQGICGG